MPRDERSPGLTVPGPPKDDPALPLLATGQLEILGLLPRSSNYTFLARVRGDAGETLAVYKPRAGETPLWDFPDGTLCQREVAAYKVARTLGWPWVPPTVLRDGPEGPGSVQLFVEFDPEHHYFTLIEDMADELRRVALFDLVVNNADRKGGHCLLAANGRMFVVDHGVCFSAQPKLRTVIWDFAGEPVPERARADVRRLAGELLGGSFRDELRGLLSAAELDATARRATAVAELAKFPEPGPGRPYPWPPV